MEGRDLGKIRKEGYFRGTKANVFRYQFIGITLLVSCGIGMVALRMYRKDRYSFLIANIGAEDMEATMAKRAALVTKRIERTREMSMRDKSDGI